MNGVERLTAKLLMVIAPLAGGASLLLFVIFLFMGSLHILKMGLTEVQSLAWDGVLSVLFFIQHSGMIRRGFRTRLSRIIPSYLTDTIYTIFSGIMLTAVVVFWQPSVTRLYDLQGFSSLVSRGIFFMAIAGFMWGVYNLKSFDLFGRIPIKAYLSKKPVRPQTFVVKGPYLWVRHPLYFLVLILMWSCPDLTLDRLFFNVLWSVWIYVGSVFEEKDLLLDFGDKYREYQRAVPMLFPWKGAGKRELFKS